METDGLNLSDRAFAYRCGMIGLLTGLLCAGLINGYVVSHQKPKPLGQVWIVATNSVYAFSPSGEVIINDTHGKNYFRFYPPPETVSTRILWNSSIQPGFEYVRYSFPNGEAILTARFYRDSVLFSLTVYGEVPSSMYAILNVRNVTISSAGVAS